MNNEFIKGKVINISKSFLEIECDNGMKGQVHISNVSDYYISNIWKIFEIGHSYWFLILEKKNILKLSWKDIYPRFLNNPFKFEIKETKNGFKNLKKNTLEELI